MSSRPSPLAFTGSGVIGGSSHSPSRQAHGHSGSSASHNASYTAAGSTGSIPTATTTGRVSARSSSSAAPVVAARVDNHASGAVALDFSFQELKTIPDVQDAVRNKLVAIAAGRKSGRAPPVMGIKLCYNSLTSIRGLAAALSAEIPDVLSTLAWLDLSANALTSIEDEILQFTALTSLYLHSNHISQVSQVKKLAALTGLSKLTMHDNSWLQQSDAHGDAADGASGASAGAHGAGSAMGPHLAFASSTAIPAGAGGVGGAGGGGSGGGASFVIKRDGTVVHIQKKTLRLESTRFYREQLIWALRGTKLRSLDFMPISQQDRAAALSWSNIYRVKTKAEVAAAAAEARAKANGGKKPRSDEFGDMD